jgi:hypothetical protein
VLPPLPALATVGLTRGEDGLPDRLVLLDVEGIGSISVAGDPDRATDVLRFMAGDLAYNGWGAGVDVIACGMGSDLASLAPERIHCVSDFGELRDYLLADAVLRPAGNPLQERIHNEYGDAWLTPRVVLLATCGTTDDVAAVRDLLADIHAAGRSLLGVVIAGDHPDAHWRAHLDDDGRLHLPELPDLAVVEAQTLPAELINAVGETIAIADADADIAAPPAAATAPWARDTDIVGGLLPAATIDDAASTGSHPDSPTDGATGDRAAAAPGSPTALPDLTSNPAAVRSLRPDLDAARTRLAEREALDPDLDEALARYLDPPSYQATAAILGPVTATAGGPPVLTKVASQAQVIEFLLYLALSEHGKTSADVAVELFKSVRRDQIRKITTEMRKWLGTDAGGELYLPRADTLKPPRYLISDSLLLDWHLLLRLRVRAQARAAAEHTEDAIADYRAALGLVRGRPFDKRRALGYEWLIYCGGLEHHIVSGVVDTAHELALLGMSIGDGELVDFATSRAVKIDHRGTSNQHYADRLRWQMQLGNKDKFEEIVRELIEIRSQNSDRVLTDLDIDGEPGDLINEFLGRDGLRVLGG